VSEERTATPFHISRSANSIINQSRSKLSIILSIGGISRCEYLKRIESKCLARQIFLPGRFLQVLQAYKFSSSTRMSLISLISRSHTHQGSIISCRASLGFCDTGTSRVILEARLHKNRPCGYSNSLASRSSSSGLLRYPSIRSQARLHHQQHQHQHQRPLPVESVLVQNLHRHPQ